ncbi:MAG: UDP-3-O-acyl-N-acetylglucosamine deacetylase [Proteobacteria bacterium]|nr:UDP-3-O-acyl-N-acetylglucosamine deacetylase [Pseudomonadota bacterium]
MATNRIRPGGVAQTTLKNSIGCRGIGLHSGVKVSLTLHPAEADTGIVFERTDLPLQSRVIRATWDKVVDTRLCTAIGNEHGATIGTIEHLMAALAGCHLDNARIEIDGPEVPAMDGSSAPFVFLVECAGLAELNAPRRAIEVLKAISVSDSGRIATLLPHDCFAVSCEIDFDDPAVAHQILNVSLRNGTFKSEVCRARTFGFAEDVDRLRAAGLALGGSMDNAIVIRDGVILNEEGLRYDDEFVRHKVLDSIGDLYLAGGPILGQFRGHRSGHEINNLVLRTLFADETAWRSVEMTLDQVGHAPAPWDGEAIAASA